MVHVSFDLLEPGMASLKQLDNLISSKVQYSTASCSIVLSTGLSGDLLTTEIVVLLIVSQTKQAPEHVEAKDADRHHFVAIPTKSSHHARYR